MKKTALLLSFSMLIIGTGAFFIALTSGNDIDKIESEKPLVLSMTASVASLLNLPLPQAMFMIWRT